MIEYRDWFIALPPTAGPDALYKAILVLFPRLTGAADYVLLDAAQAALKPAFVRESLMVGQFHPECQEGGVRNPKFRPLAAPVPMLAIRHVTEWDLPFLTADPFFAEYERQFGAAVPDRLKPMYEAAVAARGAARS
jgi:hypothetical protein